MFRRAFDGYNTLISIPFLKDVQLDLGFLYVPFVLFIITGFSNAVNLTDGLDGLAAWTDWHCRCCFCDD